MIEVLILYYSRYGATEALAREVCKGVDSVKNCSARLRTVPAVSAVTESTENSVPESGPPYATLDDLRQCSGIVMGSPTRFGNMSAALKYFLDTTGTDWVKGTLIGKPAGVFTSTSTVHGGNESTLLTMAIPLLHHGMLYVGLPYSEESLTSTTTGGSPYGASHVSWNKKPDTLSDDEKRLAIALGKRVAEIATKLVD
jgi:NAD(P)H dehydrogenase (quinone)